MFTSVNNSFLQVFKCMVVTTLYVHYVLQKEFFLLFNIYFLESATIVACESESHSVLSNTGLSITVLSYTVHGILQDRILEWVDFLFSMGSSPSRDRTQVSHIAARFIINWATREAHGCL